MPADPPAYADEPLNHRRDREHALRSMIERHLADGRVNGMKAPQAAALIFAELEDRRERAMELERRDPAALKALIAILADESVRAAMTPEHFDLARAAGWKHPNTRTFRVHLAAKPTDILVHLVEHGAMSPASLDRELGYPPGGLYAGGLTLLHELGLAYGPLNEHERIWSTTEEGRRLVAEAKARVVSSDGCPCVGTPDEEDCPHA